MRAFTELCIKLDETTKTNEKVKALTGYFSQAAPGDAAWGVFFLSGRKVPQAVTNKNLRLWTLALAQLPEWLFAECYEAVGDLAETISLVVPSSTAVLDISLQQLVEEKLLPLKQLDIEQQRQVMIELWSCMDRQQCFIWNKLITGQFRVGVSQSLITQAIAQVFTLEKSLVAQRLMGNWQPGKIFWQQLIAAASIDTIIASQPYPFCLANALFELPQALGEINDWQAEWKWDGIRAQVIKRSDAVYIWSRGEELITEQFPEIADAARQLPNGTVLDGEILPWQENRVALFALLQRRLGRKSLSKRLLEEIPVIYYAYDILEWAAQAIHQQPLVERRRLLEAVFKQTLTTSILQLSVLLPVTSWGELTKYRERSREHLAEGLMLKYKASPYLAGRQRGAWWKWKVDPYTVDAVLIAAQRGHGRRAGLYTDYTFAVWSNHDLVPFAKAYSGLTDKEINQVDAFIKRNTLQKFGPVRSVKAELVFEIAFEGIQYSKRHKSGIAVRFPRILRWRLDKTIEQADTIETLRAFLS